MCSILDSTLIGRKAAAGLQTFKYRNRLDLDRCRFTFLVDFALITNHIRLYNSLLPSKECARLTTTPQLLYIGTELSISTSVFVLTS